jgi:CO/xanthine dehydrogenase Mo-binding subunit
VAAIDSTVAAGYPGVHAVLTAADLPGAHYCGLEASDQAVLAQEHVTYVGEPVALVAAGSLSQARAAARVIDVTYDVDTAVTDPLVAVERGDLFRSVLWKRGPQDARGAVCVEGFYEVGMQDQAPLGPESGLAIPDGLGGVDLYAASQWLHSDLPQIARCLALSEAQVRVHPGGIGGAFGAREDVNLQVHLALLALHTGRPVKMVYDRRESFVGHVHRHPAQMWYRHEADLDGRLVRIEATLVMDGGAYASTSGFVIGTAAMWAAGPYQCPSVEIRGFATRTNNPPAGAMRGFGAVQACIGYEAQMDKLAAALGLDAVTIRRKNALRAGDPLPVTGQQYPGVLAVTDCLDAVASLPLPDPIHDSDIRQLPGTVGLSADLGSVRRGIGYAVGIKNAGFPEGFDDYAEARVILRPDHLEVQSAGAEVGQGLVTVLEQIARTTTGIDDVRVVFVGTSRIGSAGSTSASRQTQLSGGAVQEAAQELRSRMLDAFDGDRVDVDGVWQGHALVAPMSLVLSTIDGVVDKRFRHPPTVAPDVNGQGSLAAEVMIAAHRAVVDVDVTLGLVRVVQVATAQDVGKVINPQALLGQIEGGIAQGVALAVSEELIVRDGRIVNADFTDYLLPTCVDAAMVDALFIEVPSLWGPFGAKGAGEPPTVSSPAAVLAAIRDATGVDAWHAPVSPDALTVGLQRPSIPHILAGGPGCRAEGSP